MLIVLNFSFFTCSPLVYLSMNVICGLFPGLFLMSWLQKFTDITKDKSQDPVVHANKCLRKGYLTRLETLDSMELVFATSIFSLVTTQSWTGYLADISCSTLDCTKCSRWSSPTWCSPSGSMFTCLSTRRLSSPSLTSSKSPGLFSSPWPSLSQ